MRVTVVAFFCDNKQGEEIWTLNSGVWSSRQKAVDHINSFLGETLDMDEDYLDEEGISSTLDDFLADKRKGADCQILTNRYGNNWFISVEEMSVE